LAAIGPSLARRWLATCLRIERAAARWLHVHDLAQDIGSRRWLHGAATCATLAAAALALWPSFARSRPRRPAAGRWHGAGICRAGIRPLAQGAGNGRHFAATARVVHLAAAPERPSITMTATLGENDSLARMLQRSGLAPGDAAQVSGLIARASSDQLAPGTRFQMTLGAHASPLDPRPLETLSVRARFDLAIDIVRAGGGLALRQRAIPVDTAPVRLTGIVGSSLYRSARAAGASLRQCRTICARSTRFCRSRISPPPTNSTWSCPTSARPMARGRWAICSMPGCGAGSARNCCAGAARANS
jgi:hypothetical protein